MCTLPECNFSPNRSVSTYRFVTSSQYANFDQTHLYCEGRYYSDSLGGMVNTLIETNTCNSSVHHPHFSI